MKDSVIVTLPDDSNGSPGSEYDPTHSQPKKKKARIYNSPLAHPTGSIKALSKHVAKSVPKKPLPQDSVGTTRHIQRESNAGSRGNMAKSKHGKASQTSGGVPVRKPPLVVAPIGKHRNFAPGDVDNSTPMMDKNNMGPVAKPGDALAWYQSANDTSQFGPGGLTLFTAQNPTAAMKFGSAAVLFDHEQSERVRRVTSPAYARCVSEHTQFNNLNNMPHNIMPPTFDGIPIVDGRQPTTLKYTLGAQSRVASSMYAALKNLP